MQHYSMKIYGLILLAGLILDIFYLDVVRDPNGTYLIFGDIYEVSIIFVVMILSYLYFLSWARDNDDWRSYNK